MKFLPIRRKNSHKYDYGSVLAVGGSTAYPGAAALCTLAAVKSGAGLVTLAFPGSIYCAVAPKLPPEIVLMPLPDGASGAVDGKSVRFLAKKMSLRRYDAVVAGCGLGPSKSTGAMLELFRRSFAGRLILDADALNFIAASSVSGVRPMSFAPGRAVFTPHEGEAARLLGLSTVEIARDRKKSASAIARRYGCVCVLKGAGTVVADGKRFFVNATGNPGMATAGSGDVLSGVIAALSCVYDDVFDAAAAGVTVHGMAGDIAARKVSRASMNASDIIANLPSAFKRIER